MLQNTSDWGVRIKGGNWLTQLCQEKAVKACVYVYVYVYVAIVEQQELLLII